MSGSTKRNPREEQMRILSLLKSDPKSHLRKNDSLDGNHGFVSK